MKSFLSVVAILSLSACSTIVDGRSQQIMVNTNPSGANCNILRNGDKIASIIDTPGSAYIEKTKYDIKIECRKSGYQDATYMNHSGTAGATWGNIVAGGLIGWGVDSATGSDNKYESPVNITLVPEEKHEKKKSSHDSDNQ
ncbi:MAG TPA: hypothetical protein VHC22_19240 [Pirellulales bacterium]|nr:hypothetical protein [Pirellulales bacterium]